MTESDSSSFRQRTLSGIGWTLASNVARQVLGFSIGILLARLLGPEVLGLIGLVTVFTGFAAIYADLGLGAALVQRSELTEKHFSSVFWVNLIGGAILTLLFAAASPAIAWFYEEPVLIPITLALSFNFVIASTGIIHGVRLTRALDFKTLAIVDLASTGASGLVAVVMALQGFEVWSLVGQAISQNVLRAGLLWIVSSWRPTRTLDLNALKDLMGFSANLLGFTTLNYWTRNGDNLLIGKVLGSSALGLYGKAYSTMLFPVQNISGQISRVIFPAFSKIQDDHARISRVYLQMTRVIALITFPMMAGVAVVSEPFVLVLFGSEWAGMIDVLRVLSLIGLMQSIGTLNGNLFLATGRADLQFRVGGTVGVLGLGAIAIGLQWGILGVAIAYATFSFCALWVQVHIAVSLVGLGVTAVVRNLASVTAAAGVMALLVLGVAQVTPETVPQWGRLASQVTVGAMTYLALVHIAKVPAYLEVRDLIREKTGRR